MAFEYLLGALGRPAAPTFENFLQGTLAGLENQAPPQLEPVPSAPNPFAAMGSTFAATLADALGARGTAHANQERIAQAEAAPREAEARNRELMREHIHEKQKTRLQMMMRIGEAKLETYQKQQDFDQVQKQTALLFKQQKDLKQMEIDGATARGQEVTARTLAAIEARTKGQERVLAAREVLKNNFGTTPRGKFLLARADRLARSAAATVAAKYAVNEKAGPWGDRPYTDEELEADEAKLQVDIAKIYEDALADLAGAGMVPTTNSTPAPSSSLPPTISPLLTTPTSRKPLSAFGGKK